LRTASLDNKILLTVCQDQSSIHRLSVDDFGDFDENEITSEEIHLTILRVKRGVGEDPLPICLKLSATSAQELVRRLNVAILKRGGFD
jgi:hypothetical protein